MSERYDYYVPPSVKPGDSIPWSRLSREREIREYIPLPSERRNGMAWEVSQGIPFTPIPYCTFGDYDNSTTCERSNLRTMRAEFPWLVHVYGDHGSEMIGYLGRRESQNPRLLEAIDALESYPVHDESDESDLRMEREREAWDDGGCQWFADFLVEPHEGIANFGIPAGIPLALLLKRSADLAFTHNLTYQQAGERSERERAARADLTEAWFVVLSEHGSGETSREEGGGGIYFDHEDWYRTAWRAIEKRANRLAEMEHARSVDPRVAALESQGYEGRVALCDLLQEHGLSEAEAHVRYYREDNLGDALARLEHLADEWIDSDDE